MSRVRRRRLTSNRKPDLDDYREYISVCDSLIQHLADVDTSYQRPNGSGSDAKEHSRTSLQDAVSEIRNYTKWLSWFEKHLNRGELLIRNWRPGSRRSLITPAGYQTYRECQRVLAAHRELEEGDAELTVGVTSSIFNEFGGEAVHRFMECYKEERIKQGKSEEEAREIQLNIYELGPSSLLRQVRSGDVDIALGWHVYQDPDVVQAEIVSGVELVAVVAKDHQFNIDDPDRPRRTKRVRLEDLNSELVLTIERRRELGFPQMPTERMRDWERVIRFTQFETVMNQVRSLGGVGLVPSWYVRNDSAFEFFRLVDRKKYTEPIPKELRYSEVDSRMAGPSQNKKISEEEVFDDADPLGKERYPLPKRSIIWSFRRFEVLSPAAVWFVNRFRYVLQTKCITSDQLNILLPSDE